jgi:hypothetical protein
MDAGNLEQALDLGAWIGRKQAFGGMAGRCSAADAHCLATLRETKGYKGFGLTWEEFCSARLGISRAQADRTIRMLEEFGETYFYLTGLVSIAPADYRRIAGAVSADGVEHAGERIPIVPQNAARLAGAVENLKQQARLALPAPEPAATPAATPAAQPAAAKLIEDPVWPAIDRLQDVVGELERRLADGPGRLNLSVLMTVLGGTSERLGRLHRNLRA